MVSKLVDDKINELTAKFKAIVKLAPLVGQDIQKLNKTDYEKELEVLGYDNLEIALKSLFN